MKQTVHCEQIYPVASHLLWQFVRNFYDDWHPAMKWCKEEASQVRHFLATDGNSYKEQLIEHSDSKQMFSYRLLEGIKLESYEANVKVEKLSAHSSKLIWSARIDAHEKTAHAIAAGTKIIFEMGLEKLEQIILEKNIQTLFLLSPSENNPNLAVDTAGSGDICLFLHGIGGNRSNWSGQLIQLSSFCRTVALDLRGYGDSERSHAGLSVESISNDILAIMQHFKAEKIHLVGLSLGSWLAASFADRYPEKVASLTLTAGSTGMSEASQEEKDGFSKARLEPIQMGVTPADIAENVIRVISGPFTTDETKNIMTACMRELSREAYLDALICFLNPPSKINFEAFLFPTLFIAGEHDKLASPEEMRSVAAQIPGAHFKVIPEAGHLVNLDCPEVFNETLSPFLREVAS